MRSRGFLLIESFIAVLILGAAVAALLSAIADSSLRSARAGQRSELVGRAHDILTVGIVSFNWGEPHRSGNEGHLHWDLAMVPDIGGEKLRDLPPNSPVPITATISIRSGEGGGVRFATMFVARTQAP